MSLEEKVRNIIDTDIKPRLQMDGGDIQLIGVENGKVKVRLQGACAGCPGATMTLKMGVERHLKQLLPEIKEVVNV